jgi:hypothetical protein
MGGSGPQYSSLVQCLGNCVLASLFVCCMLQDRAPNVSKVRAPSVSKARAPNVSKVRAPNVSKVKGHINVEKKAKK